ncbi:MAG: SRPBCC family protein [Maribacter sp.]|nr:SRPBCC family protein [Maribacter sp.]
MKPPISRFSFFQILQGLEGVIIIIACYITFFLKPLRNHWGLRKEEANRKLPGDGLVDLPKTKFTHAVNINAPAEFVWPWIAQIGQGRGGFYTYEALENLIGLNIYNSDVVLPEFQNPNIGDIIPFGPDGGYPLVICEEGSAMAIETSLNLEINRDYDPYVSTPEKYLHLSWLWYVEALDGNHSRFISRNRVDFDPSFKAKLIFRFLSEPIIFAMDRKMCLGIKKRAEHFYKNRTEIESVPC